MKILIVLSCNSVTDISNYTFVYEQSESLKSIGILIDYYCIRGKGYLGYLGNLLPLTKKIKEFNPDIVHAHSGLVGLLSNLQRQIPVVTTFHGSDINNPKLVYFSRWSIKLSRYNIFVSNKIAKIAQVKTHFSILPCGVNLNEFVPLDKLESRSKLGFGANDNLVLFSGRFDSPIKNAALAKDTIAKLNNVKLIELKGFSRKDVNTMLCAVDAVIMTSLSEGSSQIIKEAMACNCPIVSVNVGDVEDIISETDGCYVCENDPYKLANKLELILKDKKRTNGRKRLLELELDNKIIAQKLWLIYSKLLAQNKL